MAVVKTIVRLENRTWHDIIGIEVLEQDESEYFTNSDPRSKLEHCKIKFDEFIAKSIEMKRFALKDGRIKVRMDFLDGTRDVFSINLKWAYTGQGAQFKHDGEHHILYYSRYEDGDHFVVVIRVYTNVK